MILEMREITKANWEETKFISWTCHGKVELVLYIIPPILQGIITSTEASTGAES